MFFELQNVQHFVLYLFPAFVGVFLFAAGLAFSHFQTKKRVGKEIGHQHRFAGDIEEAAGPFPLVLLLIIAGTIIWGFFYILVTGILGVKI